MIPVIFEIDIFLNDSFAFTASGALELPALPGIGDRLVSYAGDRAIVTDCSRRCFTSCGRVVLKGVIRLKNSEAVTSMRDDFESSNWSIET